MDGLVPGTEMGGAAQSSLSDLPLRPDLRSAVAYGAPQIEVPYRLNTNENPFSPSPEVLESITASVREVSGSLNRYPDMHATELRADLAAYLGHGLRSDEVWAANGSNEILHQLFLAFAGPGARILSFDPTYSVYRLLATSIGAEYIAVQRDPGYTITPEAAAAEITRHQPDVVVLGSPNNPTGTALDLDVVLSAIDASTGMVIVDEAYAEFARAETRSALELLPAHPRLVVTRTLSKAFGMAGLRLGYLAGSSAVIDALQLVRLTYHLSSLTQAAARAALRHADSLKASVAELKRERIRLEVELTRIGLSYPPSDANFLLIGQFSDESEVWRELLVRGVLARDVGLPGRLRVTVGTPSENDAFLAAMTGISRMRSDLLVPVSA